MKKIKKLISILISLILMSIPNKVEAPKNSEIEELVIEELKEETKNYNLEATEIINDDNFLSILNVSELSDLLIYIDSLCVEYDVEYEYIKAIISSESRWKHSAIGIKDYGLMQITPIAAKEVKMEHGQKQFDPKYNVLTGIKLLSHLKGKLGSMDRTLVAYNAGIGNVKKYGQSFVTNHKYLKEVKKWLKYFNS